MLQVSSIKALTEFNPFFLIKRPLNTWLESESTFLGDTFLQSKSAKINRWIANRTKNTLYPLIC